MRMGSIGLLCATQMRAPHCSHSQLNDGVDGIGTSSTRGQASTSRNSKSGMHERYTQGLFWTVCQIIARYPCTTAARFHFECVVGVTMSALGQKRTWRQVGTMSALPPKADILGYGRNVRFVPKADIIACLRDVAHPSEAGKIKNPGFICRGVWHLKCRGGGSLNTRQKKGQRGARLMD